LVVILIGAVFLVLGALTVQGTLRDTLGAGVGSIIYGLLSGSLCIFWDFAAAEVAAPKGESGTPAVIVVVVNVLAGLGFLAAGGLALASRARYEAWRQANSGRRA
jgi:hypothetical protein